MKILNARLSQDQNARYTDFLYARLQRQGFLYRDCQRLVNQDRNVYAACMVAVGLYDEAPKLEREWESTVDECSIEDAGLDSDGMKDVLSQWFSEKQLALIECAFEGTDDFGVPHATEDEREKASNFRNTEDYTAEEALTDIFQNVIDHDGVFKP